MKISLGTNIRKFSNNNRFIKNAKLCFDFNNIILLSLFIIISAVVLYPILMIILSSFKVDGVFSIEGYKETLSSASTYKALLNTFKLAFGVLGGTLLFGGVLALLCNKTDFKHKKIVDFFVFLSFTIPSYVSCIAWVELTCRGGYIHRILKMIFPSISYNFNTYSLNASIIVMSLHLYPLMYFAVSNALKKLSGEMEKSAKVCGANNFQILVSIVIPLMIPAVLSTSLLVISRSMANFGVVAQLALPVGKEVLTTRIFGAVSQLNLPVVSVLSLILVLISYIFYIVTEKIVRRNRYYLSGFVSEDKKNLIELKKWKVLINIVVAVFFFVVTVVPLITIVLSSFMKRWGIEICLKNMTFKNYVIAFVDSQLIRNSILNSIFYGIVSATIAVIVGSIIVYLYRHAKNVRTKTLMNISQLSITFPNMILAIGATFAWINKPLKLYGTKWIIIITYIALFIPIAIKQIKGLAENVDESIDKSARTMGVPIHLRFFKMFVPQINRGIASGWIVCFLIALREIPISLLLYSKGTETIGVMLFTVQSNSYGLEMTSTIAVVVIAISIIGNVLVRKISFRR